LVWVLVPHSGPRIAPLARQEGNMNIFVAFHVSDEGVEAQQVSPNTKCSIEAVTPLRAKPTLDTAQTDIVTFAGRALPPNHRTARLDGRISS